MSPSRDPKRPDIPTRSEQRIDADVREELEGWIEERTLELIQSGVAANDARARAHREFGDLANTHARIVAEERSAEREKRVTRWLGEVSADARAAMRFARRTPLATGVLIATFALGIGATTAIYSAVHTLLLRALPYAREATLVQIAPSDHGVVAPGGEISADAFLALRERASTLSAIAGVTYGGAAITGDGEPESVNGSQLTANFFSVAGVTAAAGRLFVDGDEAPGAEPAVVLSDRLWARRYGRDPSVIGRKIDANGKPRRVIGVTPPGFFVPTKPEAEIFFPFGFESLKSDPSRMRKYRFVRAFARLRDGTPIAQAQSQVDAIFTRLATDDADAYSGITARLQPVRNAVSGHLRPALLVLMGAALTVLLIACANITVVLLTRTMSREQELAVRAALGAGRGRLARQLLVESLTLALIGGVAGIALASLLLRLLSLVGSDSLPPGTTLALDAPVLIFTIAVTLISGVLFGLAPALIAGANVGRLLSALSTRATSSRLRGSFRTFLVGGQLALSVALLLSASLLVRSLGKLSSLDLGFRTEQVLSFSLSLPGTRYKDGAAEDRFWDALVPQLRAIPGVVSVGSAGNVPIGGGSSASLAIQGRDAPPGGRLPEVGYATVSPDYFITLGIPLRAGRAFALTDGEKAPNVVIVNESAAKTYWPGASPIGAFVRLGPNPKDPWNEVVGVVGNVRDGNEGAFRPAVYVSQRQDHWGGGSVMLRVTGDPMAIVPAARRAMKSVDPLLPMYEIATFDEFRSRSLAPKRVPMLLMTAFSFVAILLASVGVYGVGANVVALRRRELGIRMALGASRGGVLRLVLRDALRMIVGGIIAGIPLALLLSSQLRDLLFEVRPNDPVTILVVSLMLAAVALFAAFVPARRATRVDPVRVLRAE